ncbi:hypothetical protein [Maribacter sp. 2304DJ31-5]|uniref:hypothetical protein n=1 Tax=Maribacter sp. 2304DJ31-5 TaxID=3386273 RepID=UPI0039BD0605
MKYFKHLLVFFVVLGVFNSCEEDDDQSFAFQDISAPTNLNAVFDISDDDTGTVSVTPTGEGASIFQVFFGDVEDESATEVAPGETANHVYAEGEFTLKIIGVGATGLTSELSRIVTISFTPPSDLAVDVAVSTTNSFEITVSPTASNATVFDVFFGDVENEEATTIMSGETINHIYTEAGNFEVRVIARGVGSATVESTQTINIQEPITLVAEDLVGTWVMAPEAGSLGVGPSPGDTSWFAIDDQGVIDRACYFDDTYTFNEDGSFENMLGSESWIEGWQGGSEACGAPVAPHDGSAAAAYSVDGVAGTVTLNGTGAFIGLAKAVNEGELPNVAVPSSVTYNVSLTDNNETMNVVIESGSGVFWQFKLIKSVPLISLEGTWRMAPEAGSLGVGPAPGDTSWFAIDDQGLVDRTCYFDDTYVFSGDGSFQNVLGSETWIEEWQGGSEACGAPVAPHDGSASATYVFDQAAGTLTIEGAGAYLGLPKAVNAGELPNVAVPTSITYNVTFADDNNTMNVVIEAGSGVYWQYKLIKDVPSPLEGTWRMASEAGSLGVGPAPGDTSWFAIDDQGLTDRACYFDDTYVFGGDGSFQNVLGSETWIEGWQGGSEACGAPVAPHDGATAGTFSYDSAAGTLTINGAGSYLGLPKAVNAGELPNVALPDSITYEITLSDNDTVMNVVVEAGSGVFWQYKLVKD